MLTTTGSKTVGQSARDRADNLPYEQVNQFRSLAGLALYLGHDRPEAQAFSLRCHQLASHVHRAGPRVPRRVAASARRDGRELGPATPRACGQ